MKRSSKILALVFAIAIVFSAFVFSFTASAEAEGITSIAGDFSSAKGNIIIAGESAESNNPKIDNYNFQVGNRTGKAVAVNNEYDGNTYVLFTQETKGTKTDGPYMWGNLGGNASVSNGVLNKGDNDISLYSFMTFDLDLMVPEGKKIIEGANIDFGARYWPEGATSRNFWYGGFSNLVGFKTEADSGKSYAYVKTDANTRKYFEPGDWMHITCVIEIVSFTDENIDIRCHVYFDGEYFGYSDGVNQTDLSKYHSGILHAAFIEIKLNFNTNEDASQAIAIDNPNFRKYTTSYTNKDNLASVVANKADLSTWEDNVYSEDAMPFGKLVATIGEGESIQYFDKISDAVAAANAGDTVKVVSNSGEKVVVNKEITVDATYEGGAYSIDLEAADGYALDSAAGVYTVVEANDNMYVTFEYDACFCEEYDPDNTEIHPFYTCVDVVLGNKILEAYDGADYESYKVVTPDEKIITFKNWNYADYDGNVIGPVGEDDVVTEEMLDEGWIYLVPEYETVAPTATYTAGGKKILYTEKLTADNLAGILKAADANSTVVLLSDVDLTSSVKVENTVTLDLNGHTVTGISNTTKWACFTNAGYGKTFTLTSSVPGAKIFSAGVNNSGKTSIGVGGSAIVVPGANKTTTKIIGRDADGNTTLQAYAACVYMAYSNSGWLTVDGGEYYRTVSDNLGFIYCHDLVSVEVKNALLYGGASIFAITGKEQLYTDASMAPKVTVDNCTLIGDNVSNYSWEGLSFTITNSYIDANIKPSTCYTTLNGGNGGKLPRVLGNIYLGQGNYISGGINSYVKMTDDAEMYSDIYSIAIKNLTKNSWTFVKDSTGKYGSYDMEKSSVLTTTENTYTYTTWTGAKGLAPVELTWVDVNGNTIGTTYGYKGMKAACDLSATVVENWLDGIILEWNEDTTVGDAPATFTAKVGAKVAYIPNVKLMFNLSPQTHFQANLYIPVRPEGITLTAGKFHGSDILRNNGTAITGSYVIKGVTYNKTSVWPGAVSVIDGCAWEMSFTYEGQTFTVKGQTSGYDYCNYILNEANGYNLADRTYAANVANYILASKVNNGGSHAEMAALVKANENLLMQVDVSTFEKVEIPAAVSKYVAGVSLQIAAREGPKFVFTLTDAGKALGEKVTINGVKASGGKVTLNPGGTMIESLIKDMYISVTDGENTYTATYTVENYIAGVYEAATDTQKELLKATYAYGKTSIAYDNPYGK